MKKNILISILMAAVLYDVPILARGFVISKCIGISTITFIVLLKIDDWYERRTKTVAGFNRAIMATKGKTSN